MMRNLSSHKSDKVISPGVKSLRMVFLIIIVLSTAFPGRSESFNEYMVKAGFLYNFLLFIDWPDNAFDESPGTITIGIVGKDPFGNIFKPVEGKSINGRTLVIKRFPGETYDTSMVNCQLLFISRSESVHIEEIFKIVDERPILTVGDINGFAESGGMVNLIAKDQKIRFEINDKAVGKTGINIHSRMKRLAIRIID